MTEAQKQALRNIGCSEDEIKQVEADDKRIEQGERLFELTKEQQKNAKKATATGTRTVYNFKTRERKPNEQKREIIATLAEALSADSLEIINPEREIIFTQSGIKYKLTLSQPRT